MSTSFRNELNVVPGPAWAVAGALYAIASVCFFIMSRSLAHSWPRIVFVGGLPILLFGYVVLAGYVYGDARRRGMRYVLWTLLALFLPSSIGFILYFLLRDPLMQHCAQCGVALSAAYPYCPACGAAQTRTCVECHRPLQPGWSHCAQCGAKVK